MTTKIANILQCYALGMGIKQISRSFELSCNTVRRYVRLFQECGIPIKELAAMPSARIQKMFSECVGRNRVPLQRQLELEALLPEYAARLSRRGVTVKTLYGYSGEPIKLAYVAVWRNSVQGFFTPYKGHPATDDFLKFINDPRVITSSPYDWLGMYYHFNSPIK
ncbi:hypothetical protein SAMN05444349_1021 [Bacteroides faecichinchillae]|uniref:Homeodomain-like domain-containing protein n=3 Tax=Bacteroides faecichinchillae TaxID=871325 RepID=A0A1M4T3Z0_9BACE|nr:hypothetical protein SAMN05444349_1021 [Bacteroides faecichinchillae]